jgi:heme oxygenase (biliverdin-IX-beta and delta-forming)
VFSRYTSSKRLCALSVCARLPQCLGSAVILLRLKQATRSRHAALESRSILLDPSLSRAAYRNCLRRFFGYYAPLELSLLGANRWPDAGLAHPAWQKAPLLAQDLLTLGDTPDQLSQAPQCQTLPDLSTTARVCGCLYVIEGATLGGQIVTRHLADSLAITAQCGGAFFRGYGEHTGSRWKAFGTQLTAFAFRSGCDDEIVASANETFETLDRWLYPAQLQGITQT